MAQTVHKKQKELSKAKAAKGIQTRLKKANEEIRRVLQKHEMIITCQNIRIVNGQWIPQVELMPSELTRRTTVQQKDQDALSKLTGAQKEAVNRLLAARNQA